MSHTYDEDATMHDVASSAAPPSSSSTPTVAAQSTVPLTSNAHNTNSNTGTKMQTTTTHALPTAAAASSVSSRANPAAAASSAAPIADMNEMVVFCTEKAGMSTSNSIVSKEQINKVVYEMSVNSAHFKNAQQKVNRVGEKIDKMKKMMQDARARPHHILAAARAATAKKLHDFESSRPLSRNWIVVDMDYFFAQVEIRDRPELADKPVAVGGMSMISTSNYVARNYGVRSAMPGFIAIKLCPQLIFLPHSTGKYAEVARQTREIFAEYDSHFESGSLDEAYLDVSEYVRREARRRRRRRERELLGGDAAAAAAGHTRKKRKAANGESVIEEGSDESSSAAAASSFSLLHDDDDDDDDTSPLPTDAQLTAAEIAENSTIAFEVAHEIRRRITERTRLTCSAGIGCNRMLAKIAADMRKPNDQYMVESNVEEILRFMASLSVRRIPGVGKVMERILHSLEIATCDQLRNPDTAMLIYEAFKEDTANWLISVSLGLATNQHTKGEDTKRKSISTERTFKEISSWNDLEAKLQLIATNLAKDIVDAKCQGGKTVTLKLKTTAFDVFTRAVTVERFVTSKEDLIRYGTQLLREEIDRLISVQAKQFKSSGGTAAAPSTSAAPAGAFTAPLSTFSSPRKAPSSAAVSSSSFSPVAPTVAAHSTATPSSSSSSSSTSPNPRDGILKLRLMGLRLSALKEDTSTESKVAGNKSIFSFVKSGTNASVSDGSATSSSTALSSSTFSPAATSSSRATASVASSSGNKKDHTDTDISAFFRVDEFLPPREPASSSAAISTSSSSTTMRTKSTPARPLDRFLVKNLEASFSSTTQSQQPSASSSIAASSTAAHSATSSSNSLHPPTFTATAEGTIDLLADDDPDTAKDEAEAWFEEFLSQPDREEEDIVMKPAPQQIEDRATAPTAMISASTASSSSAAASSSSRSTTAGAAPSFFSGASTSSILASPSSTSVVPSTSSSTLFCPVCNKNLGNEVGNLELNRHIDACLNGGTNVSKNSSSSNSKTNKPHGTNKRKHGSNASMPQTQKGVRTLEQLVGNKSKTTTTQNSSNNPIRFD